MDSDEDVQFIEDKATARQQVARKESEYAEFCIQVRLPFVPNGSRDRFGKLRENEGGRSRKDAADKVGVPGSDRSNRKRPGVASRRREKGAREMERWASLIQEKLEALELQQSPKQEVDREIVRLWPKTTAEKLR